MITREWLHIGNIRRLGNEWASLQHAMADRDPFQDKVPCFHQSEDAVRMKALLGMIDPFWSALPCWDANWQMPTAKEMRSERLTPDLANRKRIGRTR